MIQTINIRGERIWDMTIIYQESNEFPNSKKGIWWDLYLDWEQIDELSKVRNQGWKLDDMNQNKCQESWRWAFGLWLRYWVRFINKENWHIHWSILHWFWSLGQEQISSLYKCILCPQSSSEANYLRWTIKRS